LGLRKSDLTRKKTGVFSDGNGLFLHVRKNAVGDFVREWFFRVEVDGKKRKLALGPIRTLPIQDARMKAIELKKRISTEPDILRRVRSGASLKEALHGGVAAGRSRTVGRDGKAPTFREFAWTWMDENLPATLTNEKHIAQWYSTLETYAKPILGVPIDQIETDHVIDCLKPIWHTKKETARRVGQRISKILRVAVALKMISFDPADSKLISAILPSKRMSEDELVDRHHAALPVDQAPAMFQWLIAKGTAASTCLALIMLTAVRSNEMRGARWREFDFQNRLWTIPSARMKQRRIHRVPLTFTVIDTLITGLRVTTDPKDGLTKI